jgi:hypothetical protein
MDRIRAGLSDLAENDRSEWSNAALSAELIELAELVERSQAEMVRLIGQWNSRSAWADDGALSGPAWLAARGPMTRPAAVRLCATARLVHARQQTAKALDVGDVTTAHVEVLASVLKGREHLYAEHEDILLAAAGALTPSDLVTVARRWRALADDQLAAFDASAAFAHRHLHVSPTLGGGALDGFLDPTGTATLLAALDALVPPDPADAAEVRSLSVRRADALVMLAEQSLGNPDRAGRAPVGIDVVIDLETILGGAPTHACGARCDLEGYGPIGRVIAERLACDAQVVRVAMHGKSRVLDLGRRTRVVSPALRRAVTVRDQHCQFGGCRVPGKWCDVHHILHWLNGGETSEDNCVLLCRRHHVVCHEGGWYLGRAPDGTIITRRSTPQRHGRRRRRRGAGATQSRVLGSDL